MKADRKHTCYNPKADAVPMNQCPNRVGRAQLTPESSCRGMGVVLRCKFMRLVASACQVSEDSLACLLLQMTCLCVARMCYQMRETKSWLSLVLSFLVTVSESSMQPHVARKKEINVSSLKRSLDA